MSDGSRIYPVNQFVIHHTGTNDTDFVGWSDLDIQDWFDRVGKQHGYPNIPRSYHLHPQRDKETFSQYQVALVPNGNADDPNTDWRIIPLMREIWDNVAWGAGNWAVNQQAINLCIAGTRVGRPLGKKALYRMAELWQPQDKLLNGNTFINPHSKVSQTGTACPGAVNGQIDTIITYVNNIVAAKINAFGAPEYLGTPENRSIRFTMKKPIQMFNFMTMEGLWESGDVIDIGGYVSANGVSWYIPVDRMGNVRQEPFAFSEKQLYDNAAFIDEPIPHNYSWVVKVNMNEVIHTGDSESVAVKVYVETDVSAETRIVELIKDNVVQATKTYSEPKSIYRVYAGDITIYEGISPDEAYIVYNKTEPSISNKIVQIMRDDLVLDRKVYTEVETPEESLWDWIVEIFTNIANWLKGWTRNG